MSAILPKKPRRVLVVMINHHLGDFVLSLPAMQTLAAHFEAPVDVVVDARYAALARLLPSVRDVIPYEQKNRRQGRVRQALQFLATTKRLVSARYDVVVDLGGGIQSVTLVTLTMARRRIGLAKSRRSAMYTHRLPHEAFEHQADRYIPFMRLIGRERPDPLLLHPSQASKEAVAKRLHGLFGRTAPSVAVIHPGAGYAFRRWPGERFAAVADELASRWNLDVVVIGAPDEEGFLKELVGGMRCADRARPMVAPLDELLALFDDSRILVSNESGPTHLAALTAVPIVTIFGPTKEAVWRPVRTDKLVILRGRICPPECRWGKCPHDMACIRDLDGPRVVAAIAGLLGG